VVARPEDLPAAVRADLATAPYAAAIEGFARPSIRLRPDPGATRYPGESRVGGWPDAPVDFAWPVRHVKMPRPSAAFQAGRPDLRVLPPDDDRSAFQFVAQIDLAAVGRFDTDRLLPPDGTLLFFYDEFYDSDVDPTAFKPTSWTLRDGQPEFYQREFGFDQVDQVQVIHVPAGTKLEPCRDGPFAPSAVPLVPSADVTLPSIDAFVLAESTGAGTEAVGRVVLPSAAWHRLAELEYEYRANADIDQMLGWADNGAHGPSIHPGSIGRWADLSPADKIAETLDARLLLQLSPRTYEPTGFRFGRTLYFYVRGSDLRRGDLSNAWYDSD
jgi:uncharacterized protein YwqG